MLSDKLNMNKYLNIINYLFSNPFNLSVDKWKQLNKEWKVHFKKVLSENSTTQDESYPSGIPIL